MRQTRIRTALAVGCGVLFCATPSLAEPEVGAVKQREFLGAVGTRETGARHNLYFNESVYANETVVTGATSATNLVFLDRTNLYIGASSEVVLDRFVYDPDRQIGDVAISFGKGAFRFVTGDIQNKENVSLTTPTATMTIRGTDLLIFVLSDGTSEVNVLAGAIELLPCEAEEPVRIEAGSALLISGSCDTVAAEARALPYGTRYPTLPPEFAALEGGILPAAGDEPDDDRVGRRTDQKDKEPRERPAPEPSPSPSPGNDDDSDGPDEPDGPDNPDIL